VALTRRITNAKADDPRPEFAFDDTVKNHLIDTDVSVPLDKLGAMQESFIKAGNLKAPYDLTKITAPEIRAKALAKIGN
jgi:hypothetical protein